MLAEARQQSGAAKLAGHDIMALEWFAPDTRHMIVFDVLSHDSPMGFKGDKMRLFLTDAGYDKALENQDKESSKQKSKKDLSSAEGSNPIQSNPWPLTGLPPAETGMGTDGIC